MPVRRGIFNPIKTRRVFEEISEQIKELIFSGVLKAGDKLPPERELAKEFNAGRMVVREALRVLEQSGFVEVRQGSEGGTFIKSFDSSAVIRSITDLIRFGDVSLENLTQARLEIEKVILSLAFKNLDDHFLGLLRENIEDTEKLIGVGIRPRETNVGFHLLLAKATGNSLFEMIMQSLMDVMLCFLRKITPSPEYIRRVLDYHREIYLALEAADLRRARQKLEQHLIDVNERLSALSGDLRIGDLEELKEIRSGRPMDANLPGAYL